MMAYTMLARPIQASVFPSIMAWLIAVSFINIPFELGYLLYQGKKLNGYLSLKGVIFYNQRFKGGKILLWTILTFIAVIVLFILSEPVTNFLQTTAFSWIPDWFILDFGLDNGEFSKSSLLIVNIASLLVFVVGIPIVEEFYFRGYLLSRLSFSGVWAILLNSFLFALYHFTTPWFLVSRFLFTLPLAYITYRKKNLIPAILVHAFANSVDVIMGFLFIFGN